MGLLGEGTAAVRLPFALAGLATVLVLFHLARCRLGDLRMAWIAGLLLAGVKFEALAAFGIAYAVASMAIQLCTAALLARATRVTDSDDAEARLP